MAILSRTARVEASLAPHAQTSALSRGRRHRESDHGYRSAYQRDRDRIIHSRAFRRLEYKTQVFVNHEGDHYRTRLTHSIEVSQIGRTVARSLGLNEDLVESLALSHDLGHTPFGHLGEDVLQEFMRDHGGFSHNRQTLRIVEHLEERYPGFSGLNLTWEVREGIAKHSGPIDAAAVPIFGEPLARAAAQWPGADPRRIHTAALRGLVDTLVTDLIETTEANVARSGVATLEDVRAAEAPLAALSPEVAAQNRTLKGYLRAHLYHHHRIERMKDKAKRILCALSDRYLDNPLLLPDDARRRAPAEGIHRAIADYIAGMTDRYANEEYLRLFDPTVRV